MLFNIISYVVLVALTASHYGLAKSIWVDIIIWFASLATYYILEISGTAVIQSIGAWIRQLFGKSRHKPSAEEMQRSVEAIDNRLPMVGVYAILVGSVAFGLLHVSHYLQALIFINFAMLSLIAYLDRVFTNMSHRLVPTLAQSLMYLAVGISFLRS